MNRTTIAIPEFTKKYIPFMGQVDDVIVEEVIEQVPEGPQKKSKPEEEVNKSDFVVSTYDEFSVITPRQAMKEQTETMQGLIDESVFQHDMSALIKEHYLE